MSKTIIELNKDFYAKEAILESLSEFSQVCKGSILDEKYTVQLDVDEEYDIENIVDEFRNYVLGLSRKEFSLKDTCEACNGCKGQKSNPTKNHNTFKIDETEYIINFYRIEKIEDKNLITNEEGEFLFLNPEEYQTFKEKQFYDDNDELLQKLLSKNFIFKKNSYQDSVLKIREKKSFLFQGPSLHIIVVTRRCNLKCSYCHASAQDMTNTSLDLDKETAKKIVDRIFESNSDNLTIEFQGGEPLLNFDVVKYIVEYALEKNNAQNKNLRFALVSNFIAMNDEILDFCIKNDIGICTSLDGPKEVHNANRNGYEKVIEWIKRINSEFEKREIKENKLNALITITRKSLDYPKEIVDEYLKNGFDSIHLRWVNEIGYARENSGNLYYSGKEFIEFWKKCVDYIIEQNHNGVNLQEVGTKIILNKFFNSSDPNYSEMRSPCGAGTAQVLYDYNGSVYTCDEGRMVNEDIFKLGEVDTSLHELITGKTACAVISASINDINFCEKCVFKPYCGLCPVINYLSTGSLIANIPQTNRCYILKEQFKYILQKVENDPQAKKVLFSWIKKEN